MIAIYEEQREGAVADTIEHSHASFEKCLEVIRRMDGFTRSQITIQYMENTIMIGGGSHAGGGCFDENACFVATTVPGEIMTASVNLNAIMSTFYGRICPGPATKSGER